MADLRIVIAYEVKEFPEMYRFFRRICEADPVPLTTYGN